MWIHARAAGALLALLPLVACARKPASPAGPNVVTIAATDFAFQSPDTVPAGLTTIRLTNTGQEPHHLVMMRLDSSKTMADLQTMMANPEAPIPPWVRFPMGIALIVPGDSSNATAVLGPGHYVLACFVSSPDGKAHVMKGMVRPLEVAASSAPLAPEPAADLVITQKDYGWDLSGPITSGTHTIRVENAGPQVHETTVFLLAPDKTLADFQAWAQGGMQGAAPAKPLGGFIGPDVGDHGYFTATFVPGTYVLACFVPDTKDGKPHLVYGMVQEITVT